MKRKFVLSLFLIVTVMMMGYSSAPVAADLQEVMDRGKLIVGSDTTYPPFEFINETSKLPTGFDVDIAKEIASRMGVDVEIKTVKWESIIPSLQNKEYDVIISAMTITSERSEQISFSKPYYNSSQAILVAAGNPKNIQGESDLTRDDIIVGVQGGTTSDIYITEKQKEENIVRLDDFNLLYQKLDLGEIDVILGDFPVVAYAARTGQVQGEVVATFGSVEQFGIGVRKDDTNLLNKINEVLDAMFADGKYDEIFDNWFATGSSTDTSEAPLPFSAPAVFTGFGFLAVAVILRRRKILA